MSHAKRFSLLLIFIALLLSPSYSNAQTASDCGSFRTQTQGGWGTSASGNNPGTYRDAHFNSAFPNGIDLGCIHTLHFSSSAAVRDFLPSGSTASVLTQSYTNPVSYRNVLAGQLLALTLSVGFDAADPAFSGSDVSLSSLIVSNGAFSGYTVQEILNEGNAFIGACQSDFTASQINQVLSSINENFVDGTHDNGFLDCPDSIEEVTCEVYASGLFSFCNDGEDSYTVQLNIFGSNASVVLQADAALTGNGAQLCFGDANDPNVVSEQSVSLTFPLGTPYSIQFTLAQNPDCPSGANSTCTLPALNGSSPECCQLTFDCPSSATMELDCIDDVPPADSSMLNASSNCAEVTVTMNETSSGTGCASSPKMIQRTYTITDGTTTETCTQTFRIIDNVAPVITCPPTQSVTCTNSNVSPDAWATAVDNCDPTLNISFFNQSSTSCNNRNRTWIAVDDCGNYATCTQVLDFQDNTPPNLNVPNNVTVNCGAGILPAQTGNATAYDGCSTVTVSYVDGPMSGEGCSTSFVRTWTATDACGNSTVKTQTITQADQIGPVIYNVAPSSAIQCGSVPPPSNAYAIDACSGDTLPVTVIENIINNNCYTLVQRTYRATDACGNATNLNRNITIQDTQGPTITCPANVMLACGSTNYAPATIGNATAMDNCSGTNVTITYQDSQLNMNVCPPRITRTWKATDACGNVSSCVQQIQFSDNTAPQISCPPSITVNCSAGQSTAPSFTGTATASDACSAVTITYTDGAMTGSCPMTFTRLWQAMDACGNGVDCAQMITVIDDQAPTLTCPPTRTVSCAFGTPSPAITGYATASDACLSVTLTYQDGPISGQCPKSFTRTWKATDACGNSTKCDQLINLTDNMNPVITCPANVTVACDSDISPALTGTATAIDYCSSVTVSFVDAQVLGACPPRIERTWKATDACGNTKNCIQTISYQSSSPFQLVCPADVEIACDGDTDPNVTGMASTTGSCGSVEITYTDSIVSTPGTGVSVTCGALRTQTQGGWGSVAHGNNPGSYRDAHFAAAFPNGLVVGCNYTLTLTSSLAVQNFLPSGSTAVALTESLVDPTEFRTVLAGQLVALTLSVGFDFSDPNFGASDVHLGNMIISSGTFQGYSVQQMLVLANEFFGGCASDYTAAQFNQVLSSINENYVGGSMNNGFLDCPTSSPDSGCLSVYRTWTATSACESTLTCTQIITGSNTGNRPFTSSTKAPDNRAAQESLVLYPVPTSSFVWMKISEKMQFGDRVILSNMAGSTLIETRLSQDVGSFEIDLSAVEPGMYVITWIGVETSASAKVIKQ